MSKEKGHSVTEIGQKYNYSFLNLAFIYKEKILSVYIWIHFIFLIIYYIYCP